MTVTATTKLQSLLSSEDVTLDLVIVRIPGRELDYRSLLEESGLLLGPLN